MGKLHPNHRLVKIHRSYTVEEVANLLGKHKNTIRTWTKDGLVAIDDNRPMLIRGQDLVEFLKKRRVKNKRPCKPGQLYCFKCRTPRFPAESMAEYTPVTATYGNLVALCPDCGSIMNQRINIVNLKLISGKMDITTSEEQ